MEYSDQQIEKLSNKSLQKSAIKFEDISNKIIGAVKYSIVNLGDLSLIMKYILKQSKSFQALSLQ